MADTTSNQTRSSRSYGLRPNPKKRKEPEMTAGPTRPTKRNRRKKEKADPPKKKPRNSKPKTNHPIRRGGVMTLAPRGRMGICPVSGPRPPVIMQRSPAPFQRFLSSMVRQQSPVSQPSGVFCAICLDTEQDRSTERLSCGHSFHANCVKDWLQTSNSCPFCRCPQILPFTYLDRFQQMALSFSEWLMRRARNSAEGNDDA